MMEMISTTHTACSWAVAGTLTMFGWTLSGSGSRPGAAGRFTGSHGGGGVGGPGGPGGPGPGGGIGGSGPSAEPDVTLGSSRPKCEMPSFKKHVGPALLSLLASLPGSVFQVQYLHPLVRWPANAEAGVGAGGRSPGCEGGWVGRAVCRRAQRADEIERGVVAAAGAPSITRASGDDSYEDLLATYTWHSTPRMCPPVSSLSKRTPGATAHVGPAFAAESMAASSGTVIAAIMSMVAP